MILNRHECAYAFIVNVSISNFSRYKNDIPFISSLIVSCKIVLKRNNDNDKDNLVNCYTILYSGIFLIFILI